MEKSNQTGERIFWLLQIMFSFIITRSFFDYQLYLLHPLVNFLGIDFLAFWGVIMTIIWSWLDFTQLIYNTSYERTDQKDMWRFLLDFFIVITYTVMLFSISLIAKNPTALIVQFLLAFPAMFILYVLSGYFRRKKFGKTASSMELLILFSFIYIGMFVIYIGLFNYIPNTWIWHYYYNKAFVFLFIGIYVIYRLRRRVVKKRRLKPILGIDIDGVIADQITSLLPIIEKNYGISMSYNDIDEWKKPIKDTDIAQIIISEQRKKEYLIKLNTIPDSVRIIGELAKHFQIYLLTARELTTKKGTIQWLKIQKVPYTKIFYLKEGNKSEIDVKILIDDYPNNITDYLTQIPNSYAILFRQPWNINAPELTSFITDKRCFITENWKAIPSIISSIQNIIPKAQ